MSARPCLVQALCLSFAVTCGCGGKISGHGEPLGDGGRPRASLGDGGRLRTSLGDGGRLREAGSAAADSGFILVDPASPGCAWTGSPGPGPCGAWWGGTLAGLSGITTCPCPNTPQFLAYGNVQFSACERVTGPYYATTDMEVLSCSYEEDETGCGSSVYDFTVQIPYYGGGTGKVSFSGISVTAARAGCAAAKGTVLPTFPYSQLAKNLIGVWVNCGARDPGSVLGHDGIALHPDGSFEVLDADASDHFTSAPGCEVAGLWGLYYSPAMPQGGQVTFYTDFGITPTVATVYQGQPRQVDFDFSTFALAQ